MSQYTPNYDHIFVEYEEHRYRLSEISSIRLGSVIEVEGRDPVRCIRFLMKGQPSDSKWNCVVWDNGGEMLWDMIGETTAVLRAYTKEELEERKAEEAEKQEV